MNRIAFLRFALSAIALACVAGLAWPAYGQGNGGKYPRKPPLTLYLMDRNAEIALARSAAPASISRHATVLVLTSRGFVTAVNGTNGFTCLVERAWMDGFDDPEFWNPKPRDPICYNPPASRTVLRYDIARTNLMLAGLSKMQMYARLNAMAATKALPTPEPGSMSYMMSKHQFLNDAVGSWYPMMMFHVPKTDGENAGASWGANLPASPVVMDSQHKLWPEPQTIMVVPLSKWSDGTAGPPL